jgi:hypothetical protein
VKNGGGTPVMSMSIAHEGAGTAHSAPLSSLGIGSMPGVFTVYVRAVGIGYYQDSEDAASGPYTVSERLSTPSAFLLGASMLCWDAVSNAAGYKLLITGPGEGGATSDYAVPSPALGGPPTSLELSAVSLLTAPGKYTISVVSAGDGTVYLDSEPSAAVTYTVQTRLVMSAVTATPQSSELIVLSWIPAPHATGYTVEVYRDGYNISALFPTGATELGDGTLSSAEFSALAPGVYTFKIRALGDADLYTDSEWLTLSPVTIVAG